MDVLDVPGGLRQLSLEIAGRTLRITVPADPAAVLDQVASLPADQQPAYDPFWAQIWPSARTMSAWVFEQNFAPQTRMLELGSGLGLVGIAAMAAGLDVTLSDYQPLALELAATSAIDSGFPAPRTLVIDWNKPPAETFPLLLGCEILYDPSLHSILAQTIRQMLAPDGVCWIADPGRITSLGFTEKARACGLEVSYFDRHSQPLTNPAEHQFYLLRITQCR